MPKQSPNILARIYHQNTLPKGGRKNCQMSSWKIFAKIYYQVLLLTFIWVYLCLFGDLLTTGNYFDAAVGGYMQFNYMQWGCWQTCLTELQVTWSASHALKIHRFDTTYVGIVKNISYHPISIIQKAPNHGIDLLAHDCVTYGTHMMDATFLMHLIASIGTITMRVRHSWV